MPIYNHPADIYLNDVEYYELLSPKNIAARDLLRLARKRGYIFSDKSSSENVRDVLTSYPSSWKTVSDVLDRINKPEPDDHQTTVHATGCAPDTDVLKMVNAIKTKRCDSQGEIYSVHKDRTNPNTYNINIAYTEIDLSRSMVYQRRAKSSSIEISKVGNEITFRFSANDRTRGIAAAIESEIKPAADNTIRKRSISLRGVTDPGKRTLFFTEMIKAVEGYKFINTSHISVDRRFPEDEDDGGQPENEGGRGEEKAKQELKGFVNRVVLSGEQVMASDLYQQARKTGYYIFSLRWTCQDKKDARQEVEFEAGFEDAVTSESFAFDVIRKRTINKQGDFETVVLSPKERREYQLKIEKAAFESYDRLADSPGKNQPNRAMSIRIAFYRAEGLDKGLLSKIASKMKGEPFKQGGNSGFLIERNNAAMISGRYVERFPVLDTVVDPFGTSTSFERVDFKVARFELRLAQESFIAFDASSSSKVLVGRLSEFSDFRVSLTPRSFPLPKVVHKLTAEFPLLRVYLARVDDHRVNNTTSVRMIFESSENVMQHVAKFLKTKSVDYCSVRVEFEAFGIRRCCEVKAAGNLTIFGEPDSALTDKMVSILRDSNL